VLDENVRIFLKNAFSWLPQLKEISPIFKAILKYNSFTSLHVTKLNNFGGSCEVGKLGGMIVMQ